MMNKQRGIGLVEVLVALLLLAVGVLGFSALQFRAMDAAQEATERTAAINIARDLAERMRINRLGFASYQTAINTKQQETACFGAAVGYTPNCSSAKIAAYDATEIIAKAQEAGQTIVVADCVASSLKCIYVSWGQTVIQPTNVSTCVDLTTGAYVVNSRCQVMEAF